MENGSMIMIWLVAVMVCLIAIIWQVWKTEQEYRIFRGKIIKILKEHDAILFPPQIIKQKGKVIPYVRPIKKNK